MAGPKYAGLTILTRVGESSFDVTPSEFRIMSSIMLLLVVIVGLVVVVACGYWVMAGTNAGGTFRTQAPNLTTCPQCGARLDSKLDYCPKCSLRTSV